MAKSSSIRETIFKGLFNAADPETVRQIALDAAIVKALEVSAAGQDTDDINDSDRVIDQSIGASGNRRLAKEEINVGRPQSSSGQGAARMVAEFSEPNPQQDIVVNYEALSRELGELKSAMKSMATAFGAIISKASEEAEEEEESIEQSIGKSEIEIANEIEDEDEEEDEKEAAKSLSGPAKAAKSLVKAAEVLEGRAKAARKAKQIEKARALKGKIEKTLAKALTLLSAAPDRAEPAVKSIVSDITAFALIKGFNDLAAAASKAESEKEEEKESMTMEKAKAEDHNQEKWPSASGETHAKAPETTAKGEPEDRLDAVLKGFAILQGNMTTVMDAVAGKSNVKELATLDLGLAAKSAAGSQNPAALFKSNPDMWATVKNEQIEAAVESGEFKLDDELACQSILSMAAAVKEGIVPELVLKSRVNSASEGVRSMFAEILAA